VNKTIGVILVRTGIGCIAKMAFDLLMPPKKADTDIVLTLLDLKKV